ncbi:MAG: hypothetical protein EOO17_06195 [Chloroflexi bacterium]|nr:MAG: hypothetical protein EOO17_06195 [Chloroflexota bacterium]
MIEIIQNLPHSKAQIEASRIIDDAYSEACQLLPNIPESIQVQYDNWYLLPETGAGGYAYSADTLVMAYDPSFDNKQQQSSDLRATVFHESFHLAQGHTNNKPTAHYRNALDSAIYEGMASVFEREYATPSVLPGEYTGESEWQLQEWADSLANITMEDYTDPDSGLWIKWALYDKQSKQRWRVYKVGTWIVDRAIQQSGKDILSLQTATAGQIADLAK